MTTLFTLFIASTFVLAFSDASYFDRQIPKWMESSGVPGASVLIKEEGNVAYEAYFGYADREENRLVDSNTVFRAESISKTVTAFAVLHLVEQYGLSIHDGLYDHMTSYRMETSDYDEASITIAHLLSHTAGITGKTDYSLPPYEIPPFEEVLDGEHNLERTKMVRPAGERFEYSNQGFLLLELLVEDVSGKRFADYAKEHVLDPLGMEDSTYSHLEVEDRLIRSYDLEGEPLERHRYPFNAPGGLYTTASDIAKLYHALVRPEDNPVLTEESVAAMVAPHAEAAGFYAAGADKVGLGVFLDKHEEGYAVFHGGEGAGSLSQAYAYLESGRVLVVMTNGKTAWEFLYTLTGEYASRVGLSLPASSALYQRVRTFSSVFIAFSALFVLYRAHRFSKVLRAPSILVDRRVRAHVQKIFALLMLVGWFYLGRLVLRNLVPILQFRLNVAFIALAITLFSGSFLRGKSVANDK